MKKLIFLALLAVSTPAVADVVAPTVEERLTTIVQGYGYSEPVVLAAIIARESAKNGLDPFLVVSVIDIESRFDSGAISPAGAVGLMQVKPSTAEEVLGDDFNKQQTWKLLRPDVNIAAGTAYLAWCLKMTGGNRAAALEYYNQGRGAVKRAKSAGTLTRHYSKRVLAHYRKVKKVWRS